MSSLFDSDHSIIDIDISPLSSPSLSSSSSSTTSSSSSSSAFSRSNHNVSNSSLPNSRKRKTPHSESETGERSMHVNLQKIQNNPQNLLTRARQAPTSQNPFSEQSSSSSPFSSSSSLSQRSSPSSSSFPFNNPFSLFSHEQVQAVVAAQADARFTATQSVCLSPGQQKVVEAVEAGKSVFFTGPAGTGKSFLLKHLIEKLRRTSTYVTASTGIAAVNIAGTTIHSFAGIGLGDEPKETLVKNMTAQGGARKRWKAVQTLIIDEVSMLDADLFDKLEFVARCVRQDQRPFGGVQLILTGDFLQLPPVKKGGARLCFEAESWSLCVPVIIELDLVFRQSDKSLQSMLAEVRRGFCSFSTRQAFESCVGRKFDTSDGIEPTYIYSTKVQVNDTNQTRLDALQNESIVYKATDRGTEIYVVALRRNCPAPETLTLKKGCQVLLLHNLDVKAGLVNGARGVVIDFKEQEDASKDEWKKVNKKCQWPVVRFTNGMEQVIEPHTWETKEQQQTHAARTQMPFILAWSLTVHKCQGMTLDRVILDLSSVFEVGQAYVALSRIRSLQSLSLISFPERVIKANQKACTFYDDLRRGSNSSSAFMTSIDSKKQFNNNASPILGGGMNYYSSSSSSHFQTASQLRLKEKHEEDTLNSDLQEMLRANVDPFLKTKSMNAQQPSHSFQVTRAASVEKNDVEQKQEAPLPQSQQEEKEILDLVSDDEEALVAAKEDADMINQEEETNSNAKNEEKNEDSSRASYPLASSFCSRHQASLRLDDAGSNVQQGVFVYNCKQGCKLQVQYL